MLLSMAGMAGLLAGCDGIGSSASTQSPQLSEEEARATRFRCGRLLRERRHLSLGRWPHLEEAL